MRKLVLLGALVWGGVAAVGTQGLAAQAAASHGVADLPGDWQGTLKVPQTSLRLVVRFARGDKGLTARLFSIDQAGAPPLTASSVSEDGSAVKFAIDSIGGSFAGTLNAGGSVLSGTWSQGGGSFPLELVRATRETAWEIPAAPAPVKPMAADANPAFDVVTIKPADPSISSIQALYVNGRNFRVKAGSLDDLIAFAYDVQLKQIVGGPDWINKDRFDIDGVPDVEGVPNAVQLRIMMRKLLADRFKLTFHKEKRDMNAFVLAVAKSGSKLRETEMKGPLPGMNLRPIPGGLTLSLQNGTMGELASFMQMLIFDRPVVDRTGLTARYDLVVKFSPDDSQFNGHPPTLPKSDTVEAFPSLFDAMQQQEGLKLEAQKTPVEVIAIDHVEKPSAN